MKAIVLMEVYAWLKSKNSYWMIIMAAFLICRIFMFTHSVQFTRITIVPADVILVVIGGLTPFFHPASELPPWAILLGLLMVICRASISSIVSLDTMLLVKSASKVKWWLAKMSLLLTINITYTLIVFFATSLLSIQTFHSNSWSQYTQTFFPHIVGSSISPPTVIILVYLTLLTGFIAITSFVQTMGLFLKGIQNII